jgi:hypothetical protein
MEPLIITQVKELLAQGDLEGAVKLLATYTESNMTGSKANNIKNEIIHLQGQLSEVKKAEFKGLIAFEQAERNRNQIRVSMLSLTDAITGNDKDHPVFSSTYTPPDARPGSRDNNIYKYIVVGIAAIALFVFGILMCEEPSTNTAADTSEIPSENQLETVPTDQQTCFITTLESLPLLADADYNAEVIGSIPSDTEFEVIQTKIQIDADGESEFFQVSFDEVQGWVEYNEKAMHLGSGCN